MTRQPATILMLVIGAILVGAMVASLRPKKVVYVERRPRPPATAPPGLDEPRDGEHEVRPVDTPAQPPALQTPGREQEPSPPLVVPTEILSAPEIEGEMVGGLTAVQWDALSKHSWHVAVMFPHMPTIKSKTDEINAFHEWKLTQLIPVELDIVVRLYMFVESERVWEIEDHIRENQLEAVHVRTCVGVTESSIDALPQFNCIARQAVEEGAHFVASVDVMEMADVIGGDGPGPSESRWLLKALAALLKTDCAENIYVPEVRHLGIAGRGAQWRSELSLQQQYVWDHFRKEIIDAQTHGIDVPVLYQYKPLNQFSGSFVVHAQHVRAMKGVFEPSLGDLKDGLDWLTGLYSYCTFVSPPS